MKRLLLLSALVFSCAAALGQDLEWLLLPLFVGEPIEGAHGSVWVTEAYVHNNSSSDISLPYGITPVGGSRRILVPARETVRIDIFPIGLTEGERPVPTYILTLEHDRIDDVHFSLHVRDISRQALTWGTELPVVRVDSIDSDSIVLIRIPPDVRFRKTLRLYRKTVGELRISVYGEESGILMQERVVVVGRVHPGGYTYGMAYEELSDDWFPPSAEPLRLLIEPVGEVEPIWAFVSVTHNETQHVTTITPQP